MIDRTWVDSEAGRGKPSEWAWADEWDEIYDTVFAECPSCGEIVYWDEIDQETGRCVFCGEDDDDRHNC